MAETIEFDKTYFYSIYDVGITVSVNLFYAEREVEFDAKIDTGSTFCVFQRLHGELLGLKMVFPPTLARRREVLSHTDMN